MSVTFKKHILLLMLIALPLCGVWQLGLGAWIHAKAILAQTLLETAWSETLRTGKEVKPWPWADTWPVARLTVPRLGIRRIVLAGASGSSLAFGPGHFFSSAMPGEPGNVVIFGHRDTHFRFLKHLIAGDRIELQYGQNLVSLYEVTATKVAHRNETYYLDNLAGTGLTLITCYPFDAVVAGGPLRFIVTARSLPTGKKML
ncbi:MAG TPA: class GN sortase [Gammaproteobacteria bacterium]|nr:class GN sortase [Gammaproteobacteria bacterium]